MTDTAAALLARIRRVVETTADTTFHEVPPALLRDLAAYLAKPPPEEVARTLYEIDELGGTFAHNDCDPVKNGAAVAILENARNVLSRLGRAGQDAEARGYERGVREAAEICANADYADGFQSGALACEGAILALLPRTEGGGT